MTSKTASKQLAAKVGTEAGGGSETVGACLGDTAVERQRLDGLSQLRAELERRLVEIGRERELLAHAVEVMHDAAATKDSAALDDEEERVKKRIVSLGSAEVEQGRRLMAAEAAEKSA